MLRVKIEIVPRGYEERAEILDEVLIENDGTGICLGEDEGGVGNYNVFDGASVAHLNVVDYPSMYACARVEGVERSPTHRFLLAGKALAAVQEAREAGHQCARPADDTRPLGKP